MSDLYIPKMSDTIGETIQGLADNFTDLNNGVLNYNPSDPATDWEPSNVASALDILAGSRIVEQGENENGYYAMFACGIIISFLTGPFRLEKEGSYFQNPWNLPRSYVEIGSVDFKLSTDVNRWDSSSDRFKVGLVGIYNTGITSTTIPLRVASNPAEAFGGGWVDVFCLCAIGRWK